MLKFKKFIAPENIFLTVCLLWGILFTFINPPFQGFDEVEHFYRVYAFSDGTINLKKITSHTDGIFTFKEPQTFSAQIIPVSIVRLAVESKALNPYIDENKVKHPHQKIKFSTIKQQAQYKLDKNFKTIVVHMIPSYTIMSYLPHTIVLTLMKQINANPIFMIFILRLCSLFLYTGLIYLSIKTTPVKKYLFTFLSITPLAIYLSSIINTDHIVLGLSFLLTAYVLKLKYAETIRQIGIKELCYFFALIFLLCICKFTYLPMILLFFLIPSRKFLSTKYRNLSFLIIFITCILWIISFLSYNIHIFNDLFSYYCKNNTEAIISIFTSPITYITSITKTTIVNFTEYITRAFFDFGFSDTPVNTNMVYSLIILIILNTLFNDKQKETFNILDKIILTTVILTVFIFTITANYIIFVPNSDGLIEGFKGRYLIPVLPLFFMLFDNNKIKSCKTNLSYIVICYDILLVLMLVVNLINRYYI